MGKNYKLHYKTSFTLILGKYGMTALIIGDNYHPNKSDASKIVIHNL